MTDYLEEALDNANQLLEQVSKLEREVAGVERGSGETGASGGDFAQNSPWNEFVFEYSPEVYNRENVVEETISLADNGDNLVENGVNDEKKIVNHAAAPGEDSDVSPLLSAGRDGGTDRWDVTPWMEEVDEGAGESVLAAQLEWLDRAASVPAARVERSGGETERRDGPPVSMSGLRPETMYPRIAGTAEEGWPAQGERSGGQELSNGVMSWVEQADRTFRRDNRRYDGGFYLY